MDQADDDFLAELLAEMERLAARPIAEVGVPMFLVPEDLTAPGEDPAEPESPEPLGAVFARAAALLERHRGELSTRDVAAIVEVLAERAFGERSACDGDAAPR